MSKDVVTIGGERKEFCFQLTGSKKVWRIPLMGSMSAAQVLRFRKLGQSAMDEDAMLDAASDLLESFAPGIMDAITLDQLAEVWRAWQEASGVSVGESQASPES